VPTVMLVVVMTIGTGGLVKAGDKVFAYDSNGRIEGRIHSVDGSDAEVWWNWAENYPVLAAPKVPIDCLTVIDRDEESYGIDDAQD
jgi:hypothetical protein